MERASNFENTNYIKGLLCNVDYHLNDYTINLNDKISSNHIIAIVIYTSFENLRYALQQTFIYKTEKAKDNHRLLIKRHCQFAHFSRSLRECVECLEYRQKIVKLVRFIMGLPAISP